MLLYFILLWITVPGAQTAEDNKLTTLQIKNNNFNHGTVKEDTIVQTTFTIINTGRDTLLIEDVVTSCNCTQYEINSKSIAPRDSCNFVMHMDTKAKKGSTVYNAMLKTNTFDRFYILESKVFVVPRRQNNTK